MNGSEVTLCMIVRNEERRLGRCLGSVEGLFDEVIIVDTGSIDGTVSLARSFGAQVYGFPWTGSFSEARNHGLRLVRTPWVFSLDADEWMDSRSVQDMMAMKKVLADTDNGSVGGFLVTMMEETDDKAIWGKAVRLFRNNPEIRYVYRVHEQVNPTIHGAGYTVGDCRVSIRTERGGSDRSRKALAYLFQGLPGTDPDLVTYPRGGDAMALTGFQCVEFGRWDLAEIFFLKAMKEGVSTKSRMDMVRGWLVWQYRLPWDRTDMEFKQSGGTDASEP